MRLSGGPCLRNDAPDQQAMRNLCAAIKSLFGFAKEPCGWERREPQPAHRNECCSWGVPYATGSAL